MRAGGIDWTSCGICARVHPAAARHLQQWEQVDACDFPCYWAYDGWTDTPYLNRVAATHGALQVAAGEIRARRHFTIERLSR